MPASGLIALLDDIASIADDVATLTAMAAKKTTGIVTDDMAVTAEQAIGIRREREIPVVLAVAKGSMKNKALILAPGALLLNAVAPWAILPLLMAGGTFLSFEGVEKIIHKVTPHPPSEDVEELSLDPVEFERVRVEGAIRTDLILSAEIIALTLGEVAKEPFVTQAAVLYGVSVIMTVGVYGLVGGLIKIDDLGEYLALHGGSRERIGRGLVAFAPKLLHLISIVGTAAMLMVGGHILLEGLHPVEEAVHHVIEAAPGFLHGVLGIVADIVVGGLAGLVVVGAMKTGIPGKIGGMVRRKKAAEGKAAPK